MDGTASASWPRTPIKQQPKWKVEWQQHSGAWHSVEGILPTGLPLRQAIRAARLIRETMPGVETRVVLA